MLCYVEIYTSNALPPIVLSFLYKLLSPTRKQATVAQQSTTQGVATLTIGPPKKKAQDPLLGGQAAGRPQRYGLCPANPAIGS